MLVNGSTIALELQNVAKVLECFDLLEMWSEGKRRRERIRIGAAWRDCSTPQYVELIGRGREGGRAGCGYEAVGGGIEVKGPINCQLNT